MSSTNHLCSPSEWDVFLQNKPNIHLLQTSQWAKLKADFGWAPLQIIHSGAGAQILFRQLPLGLSLAYIPKGPIGKTTPAFWSAVDIVCQQKRALFLKVEPDQWESDPGDTLPAHFIRSQQTIQPPRTLIIHLQSAEEQILAQMKSKTRYNIRLAARKGVLVHRSQDLETFSALMNVTGSRDQFGVHSLAYYRRVYELFHPEGACELFIAEFNHEAIAAIMVFSHGKRAWYFYGASSNQYRQYMPTYLLQWEAILWARNRGCTQYDLWGIPDADHETLEAEFTHRSDGLWGVYRFKRGFGGQIYRSVGAWDRVYKQMHYKIYKQWLQK